MNPSDLKPKSNVLSISHFDFDGVSCAIALAGYFKNLKCKSCTFSNIDGMLKKTNFDDYDAVFLTDCHPKDEHLMNISDKLIVLDHHPFVDEITRENVYSITDNCAAILTKNWLEATYNISISHLDTFLKYTDDYDRWIHQYKKSKMIECLFWRYGYYNFKDRFITGSTQFNQDEITYIRQQMADFNKIYNELELFEFESINACLTSTNKFINDISDKMLYYDNYQLTVVRNSKSGHTSVRTRKDNNINIGEILKDLDIGGGHPKAGGLAVDHKELETLIIDLNKLEKYLYDNFKEIRK